MALGDILDNDVTVDIERQIQDKIELWRQNQPVRNKVSLDKSAMPTNSPIDNQIANGVDFFDDDTGGHTGFVTNTDLVSRYRQFVTGNVVAEKAGVRTNTKTRTAYGTMGEYNEEPGVGLSSTSHILGSDVIVPPRDQLLFPYYANLLPIEDRKSMWSTDSGNYRFMRRGTIPPEDDRNYPPFGSIGSQVTLYGIPNLEEGGLWSIGNQPGGTNFNNPTADLSNVQFMQTPISSYVSRLNNNPDTDTHSVLAISSPKAIANTMMGSSNANYQGTSNLGPFTDTFDTKYPGANMGSSTLSQLWNTDIRNKLLSYGTGDEAATADKMNASVNEFIQVPNGLDRNNLFSTDNTRNVSNKGPFDGDRLHPILVRNFGTNWKDSLPDEYGVLDEYNDPFGLLSDLYINMSAAYVRRTNIWASSVAGTVWLSQQENLQKLNPTAETRTFNKFAVIGEKGVKVLHYTHKTRHYNTTENRYEKMILNPETSIASVQVGEIDPENTITSQRFGFGSRIAMQGNYDIAPDARVTFGLFGLSANFEAGNPELPISTGIFFANPNRYTGQSISAAPVTIVDGIPSFTKSTGTGDGTTAQSDASKILNKKGGNFNKETNYFNADRSGIAQRYASLAYGRLNNVHSYGTELRSAGELTGLIENETDEGGTIFPDAKISGQIFGIPFNASFGDNPSEYNVSRRREEKKTVDDIGRYSKNGVKSSVNTIDTKLGVIKKSSIGSTGISAGAYDGVDKVNMVPYGAKVDNENVYYTDSLKTKDFIKFRFFDIVNGKYIIFRAILSGIQDQISTDYSEEKYIGRPDKLYVYKGADRSVNFGFKVYPKSKQEFPILIEKLNYLVGLCYPSVSTQNRMKTPFMALTIGDMFTETPGILRSVTVSVEDNTTWEIDPGLQFPKHISVQCQFTYIGGHVPAGTSTRWYGGLRPKDVGEVTIDDIIQSYLQFDIGGADTIVDAINNEIDERIVDPTKDYLAKQGNKAKKWFSARFKR